MACAMCSCRAGPRSGAAPAGCAVCSTSGSPARSGACGRSSSCGCCAGCFSSVIILPSGSRTYAAATLLRCPASERFWCASRGGASNRRSRRSRRSFSRFLSCSDCARSLARDGARDDRAGSDCHQLIPISWALSIDATSRRILSVKSSTEPRERTISPAITTPVSSTRSRRSARFVLPGALTGSRLLCGRLATGPLILMSVLLAHLASHGPLPLHAELLDALDRGEQDLQPHVNEVDVGYCDRAIAREDAPGVDSTVDEVQQSDLRASAPRC